MIAGCEYCGRSLYLSEGDSCKGCGAPIMARSIAQMPVIMYDPNIWPSGTGALEYVLGRPGVNIPVDLQRLPAGRKLSDSWIMYGR
jgi:hypothetical protein